MRLRVFWEGSRRGKISYVIYPEHPDAVTIRDCTVPEKRRMIRLVSEIRTMAIREIGDELETVYIEPSTGFITMVVRAGTARGPKRFAFRNLLGWIHLFDDVPRGAA